MIENRLKHRKNKYVVHENAKEKIVIRG